MTKHDGRLASAHRGTFTSWARMRERCENPRHDAYRWYGGRGIKVCERWRSFENFLADMGERPAGTSIDRINSDGDYEPGNCRWATAREQVETRRPQEHTLVNRPFVPRRALPVKSHCPRGHEYAGDNLYVVVTPSGSLRKCRACGRDAAKRRRDSRAD